MFNVVLVHPEIPPNTGNVIRLCANTGAALHLIEPLGFPLEDAKLRRAGLDYHEFAAIRVHATWAAFLAAERPRQARLFAFTTRALQRHDAIAWKKGDWLVFGSETSGLPESLRDTIAPEQCVRLPMRAVTRSLNLSNAVAIAVFEAWRQNHFEGAGHGPAANDA